MRSGRGGSDIMAGSGNRKRPYHMMLLLALGAAVLSVVVLHKLKERRVFGLLLQERDRQLLTLELLLQKERDNLKEMKRNLDDMKAKMTTLRIQRTELANKLMEAEAAVSHLDKTQKETETAIAEKQNQINALTEKEEQSMKTNLQVAMLTKLLRHKEAEVEALKQQLVNPHQDNKNENNASRNGTIEPDDGKDESAASREKQSGTSTNYTDSSANETRSTQFKEIHKEGEWVKLTTNIDDNLKDENGTDFKQMAGDPGEKRLEKLESFQENKPPKGLEEGQGSSLQGIEQEKELNNMTESLKPENGNLSGMGQGDVREGRSNDLGISQNKNEEQVTHTDAKGKEPTLKIRRNKRNKNKRRAIAVGTELDKQQHSHSENSQNEIEERKGENSKDQPNLPENSNDIIDITGAQEGDSDESEGTTAAALPMDQTSGTTVDSDDDKITKITSKGREHNQTDNGLAKQYQASGSEELKDKESITNPRTNVEMLEAYKDVQKDTIGPKDVKKEKACFSNLQQQESHHLEHSESSQTNRGNDSWETSHSEEGTEASQMNKYSQDDGIKQGVETERKDGDDTAPAHRHTEDSNVTGENTRTSSYISESNDGENRENKEDQENQTGDDINKFQG